MSRTKGWWMGMVMSSALSQAYAADVALWRFDADGKTAGQSAGAIVDSLGGYGGTAHGDPGTAVYSSGIPHVCPKTPPTLGDATPPNVLMHGGQTNGLGLEFSSASSQFVSVADAPGLRMGSSGTFIVEGWVKLAALPTTTSGRQWLVHKSAGTDGTTDYGVLVGGADLATSSQTWYNVQNPAHEFTGGELVLVFGDGTTLQNAVSNLAIGDTEWHHVMVSYNGIKHEVVFMLDYAAELLKNVTPANVAGTGQLIIGGHSTGAGADQTLNGKLDEVRIANHSLPGSPDSVGIPSNLLTVIPKWWWNTEGGFPAGCFNADGARTWRFRSSTWKDDQNAGVYWDVLNTDPGNLMFKLVDADGVVYTNGAKSYIMFDETTGGGARTDIAPDERSSGATFVTRFKINSYSKNVPIGTDVDRCLKWIRLDMKPKGGTSTHLFWEVSYTDRANMTGISLYRNEQSPRMRITDDLTGSGWHVLHAAAYVDPDGVSHMITWLDGNKIDEWRTTDVPPITLTTCYFGENDNNRTTTQTIDNEFDYVRFSADAAWTPDGTLLTPEGAFTDLCVNDLDDDGNGLTDCADPSCTAKEVCKCYPHALWADQDDDGDVDSADFGVFQACFSGTDAATPDCLCLDRDSDGRVNRTDFSDYFVRCVGGPNLPVPLICPQ
ncbi:MAG TPA: LamG domain-containing protein [Phycisphaerae bacterium]|nr:LamG domain-containing protein [Phycisphaerae bacterium]HRY70988.1 LamG domain-containing protein [Phycisphaerae bacterium]HSA29266.1 LamG domain-containing protein [Phycisphaerae bacterium]